MEVPLTDLKAQYQILRADLLKAVDDALTSMQLTLGPNVQAFEREFAEYCQSPHAVGVGNGTEAIALALQAAGVGPGDEVITVSWTFIASIEAIVHASAAACCGIGALVTVAALSSSTGAVTAAHGLIRST